MNIPCPIGEKYLPFQEEDIAWAKDKTAVLFGLEMGLGKTIEAVGFLNTHPELETLLVVCPKTLIVNWSREISRWLISPCVDITIINYDVLSKLDLKKDWDCVIFDESHYLKNRKTLRSRLSRQIRAKYRLALTGTLILNRPEEAFHQLHVLDPKTWPLSAYNKYVFKYCAAFYSHWGLDARGASNLSELSELLKPIMIRRLKSEVLKDLPEKRRQLIELPVSGITARFRAELKAAKDKVLQIEDTYRDDTRKLNSALTVAFTEMAELRHRIGLAKVGMAVSLIEDILETEGKVVIFAHHQDVMRELWSGLFKYKSVAIHGGVSATARQKVVDSFQNDPECRVFIGQIDAAGVGITLTSASHCIFVEFSWSPGTMTQAEDRLHRIGQQHPVLIQHLVLESSMDSYMAKKLIAKQGIIEKVMG